MDEIRAKKSRFLQVALHGSTSEAGEGLWLVSLSPFWK